MADPDTTTTYLGTRYITYASTPAPGHRGCGGNTYNYQVPYMVHGDSATGSVGMGTCPDGDAIDDVDWQFFYPGSDVWAPSVVYYGGRYIMFYSATRSGTADATHPLGQKCIGKNYSSTPRGPFTAGGLFYCPNSVTGRWALDPDAFVENGNLYVAFRDDEFTTGSNTGLAVTQADVNGNPIGPVRELLRSTDMSWDNYGTTKATIENPSMMKLGDGQWHMFFSGNDWYDQRYSIGVAACGTSPLPTARCNQYKGTSIPYWGWTGDGLGQVSGMTPNKPGPGGFAMFRAYDGSLKVTWAYLNSTVSSESSPAFRFAVAAGLGYDFGTSTWTLS